MAIDTLNGHYYPLFMLHKSKFCEAISCACSIQSYKKPYKNWKEVKDHAPCRMRRGTLLL